MKSFVLSASQMRRIRLLLGFVFAILVSEGVGEISLNPRKCKHILSVKSWPAGLKLQRFIPLGPKGGWAPVGVLVSHSVY